jgi:hypothetical protein
MFNWFKKKKLIEFYTNVPFAMERFAPDNGKKDLAEILKKVKPFKKEHREVNIRKCPGIIDYCKTGYIIRAWQDILVDAYEDGEYFEWKTPLNAGHFLSKNSSGGLSYKDIIHFEREVFFDYFPRPNTLKMVLKINTPWFVKVPKGYKVLFLPVWYDNETRFSVIPGVLDPTMNSEINVQMYWHALGRQEIIKAGTPLVKVIPIKDETFDFVAREITPEEDYQVRLHNYDLSKNF